MHVKTFWLMKGFLMDGTPVEASDFSLYECPEPK
jgi:hypothetical protein